MRRRNISPYSLIFILLLACQKEKKPNVVFVFADQWRAQDAGFSGNKQVKTPNLDSLAGEAVVFRNAVSNCPVCSPARASILTGQYPLTHGVFYNDKLLPPQTKSIAEVYREHGYRTAYIGKWHLNGHDHETSLLKSRNMPVPKEHRQGFEFWQVNECNHDYNNSFYYDENNVRHNWDGYDAIAQTKSAVRYIKENRDHPFLLFLSWGPPHSPYKTAPEKYKNIYRETDIQLRPNVPDSLANETKELLRGYYAHISALDDCIGELQKVIKDEGIDENTIFVFTSDHGDMINSHGEKNKQKPWEESICIPFILKYPEKFGNKGTQIEKVFSVVDIMPTLLGLSKLPVPNSVEGIDFSDFLSGKSDLAIEGALITCPVPFHQWSYKYGGKEFRGIRTEKYTFIKDLDGPWLLYDNETDPYQLNNLCDKEEYLELQIVLEEKLHRLLRTRNDHFKRGEQYMGEWNYQWDMDDSVRIGQN